MTPMPAARIFSYCIWLLICQHADASHIAVDAANTAEVRATALNSGIIFESGVLSHSSITLRGPGGNIVTVSSMNASGFFGDGSHLPGISNTISTQTFTAAQTFLSTFTAQTGGNQISISTGSTAVNFLLQGDGATVFYPELHNSSSTTIPRATTTASIFGPCITGSTLTIITSGGSVELTFSGIMRNSTLNSTVALTFLVDGQFPPNLTSTQAIARSHDTVPHGSYDAGPFRYFIDAPTAGAHSFCLTMSAPDGGTTALGELEYDFRSFFAIKELK